MKTITFKPNNVCSREMTIEVDDNGVITRAQVIGGCNGNLGNPGAGASERESGRFFDPVELPDHRGLVGHFPQVRREGLVGAGSPRPGIQAGHVRRARTGGPRAGGIDRRDGRGKHRLNVPGSGKLP